MTRFLKKIHEAIFKKIFGNFLKAQLVDGKIFNPFGKWPNIEKNNLEKVLSLIEMSNWHLQIFIFVLSAHVTLMLWWIQNSLPLGFLYLSSDICVNKI